MPAVVRQLQTIQYGYRCGKGNQAGWRAFAKATYVYRKRNNISDLCKLQVFQPLQQ
jgi:hypothetical protein